MSDELFSIPPSEPTPLALARIELAKADEEWQAAYDWSERTGEPIPKKFRDDLLQARRRVAMLETEELNRRLP